MLALPDTVDPDGCWTARGAMKSAVLERLGTLREACRDRGFPEGMPSCAVIEVVPELPHATLLIRNVAAPPIANRIVARLVREEGLAADQALMVSAVHEILAKWSKAGLLPALTVDGDQLDALADKLLHVILDRCKSKKSGLSSRTERFGRILHEIRALGSAQ